MITIEELDSGVQPINDLVVETQQSVRVYRDPDTGFLAKRTQVFGRIEPEGASIFTNLNADQIRDFAVRLMEIAVAMDDFDKERGL